MRRCVVICAALFLAVTAVYAGSHGGGGAGGYGGQGGHGMNSGHGYNSGHAYSRTNSYRYDGRGWRRGLDYGPSWGVGSAGGSGIDPDTMDAVNARIRGLKAAAASASRH